jgi:hypothetical protein
MALLAGAGQGGVVDVDEAETLVVASRPLEVVQQRPGVAAAYVHTGGDGVGHGGEVVGEVVDPAGVVDLAVRCDRVGLVRAVLRDPIGGNCGKRAWRSHSSSVKADGTTGQSMVVCRVPYGSSSATPLSTAVRCSGSATRCGAAATVRGR